MYFISLFQQTLLKWRVKDSSLYQMSLFLSSIGVFSTFVLWPLVVYMWQVGLHVTCVQYSQCRKGVKKCHAQMFILVPPFVQCTDVTCALYLFECTCSPYDNKT